jgi:eukaryotic-like serine/threonine-protein kinase
MGAQTDSDRVIAGRYRLIERLGSGGMGTVWLARDELLRRRVAVKEVFPPPGLSDSERELLRERTLGEARTAAQLSHPNVVTIYDVAEDDGRPWIVMELIEARSLRELVDETGPLDPRAAARVGLQLLAALRSAHAMGIMHRDVKPGNVLMHADGRAVLADFGIARAEDSPTTTTSGVLVGSPSYIAPERARGERGGPASDLWSVGATLYAAVEGRPPYDRAGALPTLMAVVSEDPDPPRRAGIMWPVISGLLEADQSRRLSSTAAEQMLQHVAESGTAPVTAPMPVADQLTGPDLTGAGRGNSPATLKRAERTRAFHPRASPVPEPPSESRQPFEPPALLGPPTPAEPGLAWQRPGPSVPSRAETDQDMAVTPHTGFPGLRDPFPAEPEPPAAPGQPAADAGPPAASLQDAVVITASSAEDADNEEDPADEPARVPAETDAAPAPTTPVRVVPAPARRENEGPEPQPRRTRLLASAVALVAAAGAVIGLYVADRPAAGSSASGPGHSAAPARSQSGAPGTPGARTQPVTPTSPQPRSTPSATTPTAKTSARPDYGDQAIVPAHYHTYRDPTGFSIAMPNGWKVSHRGHYVYLTPPSGDTFLLIDQSDHPQPNPLADWQQQEANRRATYAGYHRIRLAAIQYPQAEKAADWEFTYYSKGVLTHVLNRNVLANAQHAYALYWSAAQSEWSGDYPIFAVLARTFQPARGPPS